MALDYKPERPTNNLKPQLTKRSKRREWNQNDDTARRLDLRVRKRKRTNQNPESKENQRPGKCKI